MGEQSTTSHIDRIIAVRFKQDAARQARMAASLPAFSF